MKWAEEFGALHSLRGRWSLCMVCLTEAPFARLRFQWGFCHIRAWEVEDDAGLDALGRRSLAYHELKIGNRRIRWPCDPSDVV